jgi:hypothetical protein
MTTLLPAGLPKLRDKSITVASEALLTLVYHKAPLMAYSDPDAQRSEKIAEEVLKKHFHAALLNFETFVPPIAKKSRIYAAGSSQFAPETTYDASAEAFQGIRLATKRLHDLVKVLRALEGVIDWVHG